MRNNREVGLWTRRHILRVGPAALAPQLLVGLYGGLGSAIPAQKVVAAPFSRFVDVAQAAGLTSTIIYGEPSTLSYIIESMATGCAFFDYDNDGWIDIFILGGRTLEGTPPGSGNRLYHNNRDGTFTDVTVKSGLADRDGDQGWAQGVCVGDYNNDGWEDLFVTYYGQNRLYRNNGDRTFTNVTAETGLLHPKTRYSTGCTFLDYNRDGHLDLFVSNYLEIDLATAPKPSLEVPNCNYAGVATFCGPRGLPQAHQYLYRNNGDGTFTDVSEDSGIAALQGSYCLTAVSVDADEDGWPDIFVACDMTPSFLLMNNRNGTFREEALFRGIALSGDGQALGGMGVGVGDYNLDGHTDILRTHFYNQANGLYRNNGKGSFDDVTVKAGLNKETRFVCYGAGIVDLDNDGWPDILLTTGALYPEVARVYPLFPVRTPRILFRNQGDGTFVEMGADGGPGIAASHCSRGAAFGDFDNDGDMDVLIMNVNEPPTLLRNDAPSGNHWIKVRLEGTKSNRSAIGARVVVRYGDKLQVQEVLSGCSFLSSNDSRLHFGLGEVSIADIEVRWPSGLIERIRGVAANHLITVREGAGQVKGRPFR
ncbi:MAG TPA: CRTAC1 family protein [Terracidiphilus sp.]